MKAKSLKLTRGAENMSPELNNMILIIPIISANISANAGRQGKEYSRLDLAPRPLIDLEQA